MALIKRVTRLFRADFHAVLDRVEEPDVLLRQSIREMEEDLAHDEQTYKLRQREREQFAKKERDLRQLQESLTEELDVCFTADKEELARPLMRRKLETERSLQLLVRRRENLNTKIDQLAQRLNDNRTRYESMRQKADLFDEQNNVADQADDWSGLDVRVRDEDVEVALLKERQRRADR